MKKVVLSLAVLFSVAMVACNGNKASENADSDSIVAAEEVITDTTVVVADSANPAGDTVAQVADTTVVEAAK